MGVLGDGAKAVERRWSDGQDAEAVLPLGEHDGPLQVLGPRRALCHAEQVPLVNHIACIYYIFSVTIRLSEAMLSFR